MMIDKFTEKARAALNAASESAFLKNNPEVTPWHLLNALLEQDGGLLKSLLEKMEVAPARAAEVVARQLESLPTQDGGASQAYMSSALKKVIQGAFAEAEALKDKFISSEHLVLAVIGDKKSDIAGWMHGLGVTRERVLTVLRDLRGSENATDANAEDRYQALDRFTIDLVQTALKGKVDFSIFLQ